MTEAPAQLAEDDVLTAAWLNQLIRFVAESAVTVARDSGLTIALGPSGRSIGVQATPGPWIKLAYVGPSGSYSWIEQIPAVAGGWTDGVRRGFAAADPARGSVPADPAWEANLNASLAVGDRSEATRDAAVGRLTFRAGSC